MGVIPTLLLLLEGTVLDCLKPKLLLVVDLRKKEVLSPVKRILGVSKKTVREV